MPTDRETKDEASPRVFNYWVHVPNTGWNPKIGGSGISAIQFKAGGPIRIRNGNSFQEESEDDWRLHPIWGDLSDALAIV